MAEDTAGAAGTGSSSPRSRADDADDRSADPEGSVGFERFYRAEVARVLAVVLALRGPAVGAEDVTQEAFARAYARWETVGVMDRPDLWVQRVALNLATSKLRRLTAEMRAVTRLRARENDANTDELRTPSLVDEPFWDAVRRLPDKQARVVALRYAGELSVHEIATATGVAPGTVKSQLVTARKRLAQLLSRNEEGRP